MKTKSFINTFTLTFLLTGTAVFAMMENPEDITNSGGSSTPQIQQEVSQDPPPLDQQSSSTPAVIETTEKKDDLDPSSSQPIPPNADETKSAEPKKGTWGFWRLFSWGTETKTKEEKDSSTPVMTPQTQPIQDPASQSSGWLWWRTRTASTPKEEVKKGPESSVATQTPLSSSSEEQLVTEEDIQNLLTQSIADPKDFKTLLHAQRHQDNLQAQNEASEVIKKVVRAVQEKKERQEQAKPVIPTEQEKPDETGGSNSTESSSSSSSNNLTSEITTTEKEEQKPAENTTPSITKEEEKKEVKAFWRQIFGL